MKAAKYKGRGVIKIEEVEIPRISDHEILVRPVVAGICGSDLHAAGLGLCFDNVTMGHEFSGIIEDTGKNINDFRKGDRVVINPNRILCNECIWCKKGEYNLCTKLFEESIGACRDGGFAEYFKAGPQFISKLPPDVTFEEGAIIEPLATALRAVRLSKFSIGGDALIIGAGPIGLLILQCLLKSGAKDVYVSEPYKMRRETAEKIGADVTIDPGKEDLVEYFDSKNKSPEFIFECSGAENSLNDALKIVNKRGKIVNVGISTTGLSFDSLTAILKEVKIINSFAYVDEFDLSIELMSRKFFDVKSIVTDKLPLDNINLGFERLRNPEKSIKILIEI